MITLRPLAIRLLLQNRILAGFLALLLATALPFGLVGQEPAQEPTTEPAQEPTTEPAQEPTTEPAQEPATAAETEESATDEPVTAIVNGRVVTMADSGEIEKGTILLQAGKILAVGIDVAIPEGANVIDVSGMTVTPGLVDLRSKLWFTPTAAADTGSSASLESLDGVNAYSEEWKEVARQGITAVYIQPSARGSLGGYGTLLRVAEGGDELEKLVLVKHAGFQSSLGVGSAGGSSRAKSAEFAGLKKRFSDAKEYSAQWKKYREYEEAQAKKKASESKEAAEKQEAAEKGDAATPQGEGQSAEPPVNADRMRRGFGGPRPGVPSGRPMPPGVGRPAEAPKPVEGEKPAESDKPAEKPADKKDEKSEPVKSEGAKEGEAKSEDKPPKKPDQDPAKDRLVEVLEGRVPLRMEVHGLEDAKRALEFAKEFGITIVLEGLSNLATSKEMVVDSTLPVVLGPWLDAERESYQAKNRVALWSECFGDYSGRLVIASFARSGRGSKQLRYHAAAAVAAGFEPDRVLEAITFNAALLAGAGESHGKIKEGFAADLAVFAGHPLDPATPVVLTISAGQITHQAANMPVPTASESLITDVKLPKSLAGEYVIKSQRILRPGGTFEPGLLHVADGKIKAVLAIDGETGGEQAASQIVGVRTIDVGRAVVTPGLISAHAELATSSFADRQGLADSGPVRAADVYDALLPSVRKLVDGGFLRVVSAPASDRVIAGQVSELRLLAKQPILNAELAEKVVLSGSARSSERFPSSLAGQQQLIRDAFSGKVEPSSLYLPAAALAVFDQARSDRQRSTVEGKRPVLMLIESEGELAAALKLTSEMGINGVMVGAAQWAPLTTLLRSDEGLQRPGCIVRPMNSSDYDWYATDIAELAEAGVAIGFAGEDPLAIRKTAAAAVQAGMPANLALSALTLGAANMLGMSEEAGQLVAGTNADFIIWDGSPLNLSAHPLAIVIDGTLVDEKSK